MDNITLKKSYNKPIGAKTPGFSSYDNIFKDFQSSLDSKKNHSKHDKNHRLKYPNPEKPKGQLVQGSLFLNPVKEVSQAVKTFSNAVRGRGDDYSLGKLNDAAIFLGAASIATMLASAQKSAHGKSMEFIGAATFLGAMTIWPRLIIGKPLEAITGVDIGLEYKTADGKQKPFFRDPQYIPWDLMDKKTMEKAGKKLNVPENIEDREEEIKKRMTKVATGANTWWMLSAGFSTPFLSSLAADKLRNPVEKIIDNTRVEIAKAKLEAAGIETDSRNPFVKIGASLINTFSKIFKDPGKRKLSRLLETAGSEKINDFLIERFRDSDICEPLLRRVETIIEDGTKGGKLTEKAKKSIEKVYDDAGQIVKVERTWKNYFNATLKQRWGNDRKRFIQKLLGTLGFKGEELDRLASSRNSISISDLIAEKIKEIHSGGTSSETAREIERLAEKPLRNVKQSNTLLLGRFAGGFGRIFSSNTFAQEAGQIFSMLKGKAKDKSASIETSLKISHLLKHGKEEVDEIARLVRRLDDNDVWNRLTKMEDLAEIIKDLKKMFGSKSPAIRKVVDFLKMDDLEKNRSSSRLIRWLGETPVNMLQNAAKDKKSYSNWFKKVGIKGFGLLLLTTSATLGLITLNASRNNKVKGN